MLLAQPGGGFAPRVDYPTGTYPFSVAVGDFDSDNLPDLAVADVVGDAQKAVGHPVHVDAATGTARRRASG